MDNDFYNNFPTHINVREKVYGISKKYDFVKQFNIGTSYLGRNIYALGIGNMEKFNLSVGSVHGGEYLTTMVLLKHFEDMLENYNSELEEKLNQKGYVIIPTLNPDGVDLSIEGSTSAGFMKIYIQRIMDKDERVWHANARGVDINHNFDAKFNNLKKLEIEKGIVSPAPTQYGGEKPHSEPETKALVDFCNNYNINMVFAYHSQGQEIYYDFGKNASKKSKEIAEKMGDLSGYQVAEPNGLASYGGFKDWFILKHKKSGFTIEIGKGKNPLPISDFKNIYEKIKTMMDFTVTV